jgi:hypothetical protein
VVLLRAVASAGLFAALLLTESVPAKTRSRSASASRSRWRGSSTRADPPPALPRKGDSTAGANMAFGFTVATAVGFACHGRRLDPFLMFGFLFVLPAAVVLLRTGRAVGAAHPRA